MNYNFATDTTKLESLESELNTGIANVSEAIGNIYKIYNSLPSEKIWSGKAYNSFKNKAESYKTDLDNIVNILNSYVSVIKELNSQSTVLHGEISSVCGLDEE